MNPGGPLPAAVLERALHGHRGSRLNLLVLHGSAAEREQIARLFHRESPVRGGPFLRLDGIRDARPLRDALARMVLAGTMEGVVAECRDGTLFVDEVGALDAETQRLLYELASRRPWPAEGPDAWDGRLTSGDSGDLPAAAASGRFLPSLLEALGRIRIDLAQEGRS